MSKVRLPSYARRATFVQTLVYYDGPQVMLFKSDRGFPSVGVAVGEPDEQHYALFVTEMLDATWRRYLAQKVDLRYLFRDGSKRRYFADWLTLDSQRLALSRADDVQNDSSLIPDAGFWARDHTVEVHSGAQSAESLTSFAIDGTWDASDFSRFYGKIADLYALSAIATKSSTGTVTGHARDAVKQIIRNSSWRGGGSYVGFYDSIFAKVDDLLPLRVSKIAYASPGTIDLKGSLEPLEDVARIVESFGADSGEIAASYKFVDKVLQREGLKKASPGDAFSSESIRASVLHHSFKMTRQLGIEDPDALLELCGDNVLIFSKIALSFFRRARDLYAFHAEGRVGHKVVEA